MLPSKHRGIKAALMGAVFFTVLFVFFRMIQTEPASVASSDPSAGTSSAQNNTASAQAGEAGGRAQVEYTSRANDAFDRQSTAVYLSTGQQALLPASAQQISAAEKTALFVKFMGMMNPLLQDASKAISKQDLAYLMRESERLKNENYLMLNEYAVVQERLLRSQYAGVALQAKLQEMQTDVAQHRARLLAQNDPRKDSNYQIYVSKEAQILREANAMTKFPNGMTKEAYIVQRLEQISQ